MTIQNKTKRTKVAKDKKFENDRESCVLRVREYSSAREKSGGSKVGKKFVESLFGSPSSSGLSKLRQGVTRKRKSSVTSINKDSAADEGGANS